MYTSRRDDEGRGMEADNLTTERSHATYDKFGTGAEVGCTTGLVQGPRLTVWQGWELGRGWLCGRGGRGGGG